MVVALTFEHLARSLCCPLIQSVHLHSPFPQSLDAERTPPSRTTGEFHAPQDTRLPPLPQESISTTAAWRRLNPDFETLEMFDKFVEDEAQEGMGVVEHAHWIRQIARMRSSFLGGATVSDDDDEVEEEEEENGQGQGNEGVWETSDEDEGEDDEMEVEQGES